QHRGRRRVMTLALIKRRSQKRPAPFAKLTESDILALSLGGGIPGNWASDHRREAERYTDWNYKAIRTVEDQAKQAQTYVFSDEGPAGLERKSLRSYARCQWREDIIGRAMGKSYWRDLGYASDLTKALYQQPEEK